MHRATIRTPGGMAAERNTAGMEPGMEPVTEPVMKVTDTTRGRMAQVTMRQPMGTVDMEAQAMVEAQLRWLRPHRFRLLRAYHLRVDRAIHPAFRRAIHRAGRRVTRLHADHRAGLLVCRRVFRRATRCLAMRRAIHPAVRRADHPAGRGRVW
jgi:hypothetical protein